MRQCEIIRQLFQDVKDVTSHLLLSDYHRLFEEEIKEHYPFSTQVEGWLLEVFNSEKYFELQGPARSVFFEKYHPLLFIRDLASLNNWNMRNINSKRRDQVTGLLFSMSESIAFEATLALCQPQFISQDMGSWFDVEKAMKNLEYPCGENIELEAWKGCAYFFLYFHLTSKDHPPSHGELRGMLEPFQQAIDFGLWKGNERLRNQCQFVDRSLNSQSYCTLGDSLV